MPEIAAFWRRVLRNRCLEPGGYLRGFGRADVSPARRTRHAPEESLIQPWIRELAIGAADIYIGAAAVADYTPARCATNKIKKTSDCLELALQKAPDILVSVAALERRPFTVGFAAALVTRKVSLLPSTHTPEVIRQLAGFAPDVFCLTDDPRCRIDLPRMLYPQTDAVDQEARTPWPPVEIEHEQLAAFVFTSDSAS